MTAANRGKYAEGKVREFLKAWAEAHANFCFNRIMDAKSALGAMANPQPGDFQWFFNTGVMAEFRRRGAVSESLVAQSMVKAGVPPKEVWVTDAKPLTRNGLIEVKEVKHTHLLPYKNFGVDQVGRMRIRELAGSEPLVLVCHKPEGGKTLWRAPDFDYINYRDPSRGSWDLSEFEAVKDVGDILRSYLS